MKFLLLSVLISFVLGFVVSGAVQDPEVVVNEVSEDRDIPYSGFTDLNPVVRNDSGLVHGVDFVEEMTAGDSMEPTMQKGHKAFFRDYTGQRLERGDLVKFKPTPGLRGSSSDWNPWLHRVVSVEENYVMTQGDNNEDMERVPKDNIRAVAVAIVFTQ